MNLIKDIYESAKAGNVVDNPATIAGKASLVSRATNIVILLAGLMAILKALHVDIDLDNDDLMTISMAIALVGNYVSDLLHRASNIHAGK